jgi:hypothetical protein
MASQTAMRVIQMRFLPFTPMYVDPGFVPPLNTTFDDDSGSVISVTRSAAGRLQTATRGLRRIPPLASEDVPFGFSVVFAFDDDSQGAIAAVKTTATRLRQFNPRVVQHLSRIINQEWIIPTLVPQWVPMTLGQAIRQVIQLAPRDATGQLQQNVLMVRDWFVRRYRIGLNKWDWSWLQTKAATPITTVVGQPSYVLPTDFRSPIDFYNATSGNWITVKPPEWIDRADPSSSQQSEPRVFTIFGGNTVIFYPVPGAVYTIPFRYNRNVADPVRSSDTLVLPNVDWAIAGARADTYKYLAAIRNQGSLADQAKFYEAEYERLLAEAIDTDRPNVILPQSVDEQEGGQTWYSADDMRTHDMNFQP